MAKESLIELRRELNFRKFQLNAIYEFSAAIYKSLDADYILRIFFLTLMGPIGISRAFFFGGSGRLFRKRGFKFSDSEFLLFRRLIRTLPNHWRILRLDDLTPELRQLLGSKNIHYLVNVSGTKRKSLILGLGYKLNSRELSDEDLEFTQFLSRLVLVALDNVRSVVQIVEKKRMEYELTVARDIQLSLLPQSLPALKRFDISVIYHPIEKVGGDYYDLLRQRKNLQPLVVADVEGKGLSAAILASFSLAIFHALNELYLFQPAKFMTKANSLITEYTQGKKFITLFWLLLDDEKPALTYVNAGHVYPLLVSEGNVRELSKGGLLLGFTDAQAYEEETIPLKIGDLLVIVTDGVLDAHNPQGEEFGSQPIVNFLAGHSSLPAAEIADRLYKKIKSFVGTARFNDDFTLMIIKVK